MVSEIFRCLSKAAPRTAPRGDPTGMKTMRILAAGLLAAGSLALVGPSTAVAGNEISSVDRPQPVDQPLRALAKRHDLRIGTAVDMDALGSDTTYRDLVAREFSAVTAENAMKWETLQP